MRVRVLLTQRNERQTTKENGKAKEEKTHNLCDLHAPTPHECTTDDGMNLSL